MAGEELPPHEIIAEIRMVGHQRTEVSLQHGGTSDAAVTVTVGRSVVYLHTRMTAARFGMVWQSANQRAVQLPMSRPPRPPGMARDMADPSVIVHAAGWPAGVVRLAREPEGDRRASYLHIQLGNVRFYLYDQRAYHDCSAAFSKAWGIAHEHLTDVDQRRTPVHRQQPSLGGQAAPHAARHIAASGHPAARAAAAYLPPEARASARLGLRKPVANQQGAPLRPLRGPTPRPDQGGQSR